MHICKIEIKKKYTYFYTGGNCCDERATCTCGAHSGYYTCLCPAGYYGRGLRGDCHSTFIYVIKIILWYTCSYFPLSYLKLKKNSF
jgi:hypothetical protein